jgi:hypothetical protein
MAQNSSKKKPVEAQQVPLNVKWIDPPKSKTANCWKIFKVHPDPQILKVQCRCCERVLTLSSGTTNLNEHIIVCREGGVSQKLCAVLIYLNIFLIYYSIVCISTS